MPGFRGGTLSHIGLEQLSPSKGAGRRRTGPDCECRLPVGRSRPPSSVPARLNAKCPLASPSTGPTDPTRPVGARTRPIYQSHSQHHPCILKPPNGSPLLKESSLPFRRPRPGLSGSALPRALQQPPSHPRSQGSQVSELSLPRLPFKLQLHPRHPATFQGASLPACLLRPLPEAWGSGSAGCSCRAFIAHRSAPSSPWQSLNSPSRWISGPPG